MTCRTIRCTTRTIQASVACIARARLNQAKTRAAAAGQALTRPSAVCIRAREIRVESKVRRGGSVEEEKKLSKIEHIKRESRFLRGSIQEALEDGSSHFSEENIQVLKFHGTYQQDDRDLRKQLTKEGKE